MNKSMGWAVIAEMKRDGYVYVLTKIARATKDESVIKFGYTLDCVDENDMIRWTREYDTADDARREFDAWQ